MNSLTNTLRSPNVEVLVAIDEHGKPRPVPPVIPETPDELRRFHAAALRRASRLELKDKLSKKDY